MTVFSVADGARVSEGVLMDETRASERDKLKMGGMRLSFGRGTEQSNQPHASHPIIPDPQPGRPHSGTLQAMATVDAQQAMEALVLAIVLA